LRASLVQTSKKKREEETRLLLLRERDMSAGSRVRRRLPAGGSGEGGARQCLTGQTTAATSAFEMRRERER
jgi:hypothetical protein